MPNKGRCDVFGTLFHETPLSIYVHCFALHSSRQEKKKVKRDSGPQSGAKNDARQNPGSNLRTTKSPRKMHIDGKLNAELGLADACAMRGN